MSQQNILHKSESGGAIERACPVLGRLQTGLFA